MDSQSKTSAAAGGCVIISRCALDKIGGIAGHRNAMIDDLALARRIKQAGLPLSFSLTKSVVSIRPYRRLSDVWNMVARSAFTQLRCSWLALIGTVLGMSILFIAPMAGICSFIGQIVSPATPIISLVALSLMAWTYIPIMFVFIKCLNFTICIGSAASATRQNTCPRENGDLIIWNEYPNYCYQG